MVDVRRNADLFYDDLMGITRTRRTVHRGGFESAAEAKPSYLVSHDFVGNSVEVNPVMKQRLVDVQRALQRIYDALPADRRTDYDGHVFTLREWTRIRSGRGWRPGSSTSKHASGSAVDLNYAMQPYIVTRTVINGRTTLGGEAAGAGLTAERQRAVDVYDRALRFTTWEPNAMTLTAPMHSRSSGESTRDAYRRLKSVHLALNDYFSRVMLEHDGPTEIRRRPIADIEGASEDALLAAIPTTERREAAWAIGDLDNYMNRWTKNGRDWRSTHPGWTMTPRQTYFRILRDYEHTRIPWVIGNPVARPERTRNPTRGFLHMPEEVVVALCDVGRLRWGAIDFGPASSGDVHHFDLGDHGGFTPDGTP